ncbi:MAG TPA: fatty acid desaturase [Chitinophagaceae bacterium]|jgi:linoleoyl-CoA desaturase|nr:fatty acid desaturase [Chitinophagaceae bacterium]
MAFSIDKIHYTKSKITGDDIYPGIKARVQRYFAGSGQNRFADNRIWFKASALLLIATGCYFIALTTGSQLSVFILYPLSFWFLLLLGFNIGHDAAHGCLTGNKKKDAFLFASSFVLLGANPYLWKIRHIHSHHPYPNVEGCDADMELTGLFRFTHSQPHRKIHRYQQYYAPLLYSTYTLYWIFYKDFMLFARRQQVNIHFINHSPKEWVRLFVYKLIYLFLFIGLPIIIQPKLTAAFIFAFLLSHFINSLFLLFTFLMSHHVPQTGFHAAIHNDTIPHSWAMQQVMSSADFHADKKWAYWLFGGFNAHVAHHLFPGICHIHYRAITQIIKRQLFIRSVPYHSFTWWQGVKFHFQLLKQMGLPAEALAKAGGPKKKNCNTCKLGPSCKNNLKTGALCK